MVFQQIVVFILITLSVIGCASAQTDRISTIMPNSSIYETAVPISSPTITSPLAKYEFPDSIDPDKRYMFYLHGKIIEDQGIQRLI